MRRNTIPAPYVAILLTVALAIPIFASEFGHGTVAATSGPGYWGYCETLWNATTGTDAPSSFGGLALVPFTTTDTVILDGFLYLMTKANMIGTVAEYRPSGPSGRTNDWNLSVEITRPREGSAYESPNITAAAGQQALIVYATNASGGILSGVRFVTGNPATEAIYLFDSESSSWELVADDIRPAFPHRSDAYGDKPDRYIVSFSHADMSEEMRVTLTNTATGPVFNRNLTIHDTNGSEDPGLRFDIDMDTSKVSIYNVASGWMVDNMMFRSMSSRYPVIGPAYEVVSESAPLWIKVNDESSTPIADATVSINGVAASYNMVDNRYEAFVPRAVDWDVPIRYTVLADGVEINESMSVSTLAHPASQISIPKWWNGWDWVSVIGRDDSSTTMSAQQIFNDYDHPKTNYISTTFLGNSTDLLDTQSEIAVHYPHDYMYWGHKTWDEAVNSTEYWRSTFDSRYWFASRWDDPRYVGEGDTYISIACPGNSASWEQVYAEFESGIRMMGISAQYYLGGNSSLLGSYWLYGPNLTSIPDWASWDPRVRVDMMDMFRAISTDNVVEDQYEIVRKIAENRGVLRLYNHGTIAAPAFLDWLCDPKTNLSYENWKATDGEVASYVYGRSSVDVDYNPSSDADIWLYNITRRDPTASGYWRVPVTVAVDITDKQVEDIEVTSGSKVMRASDGSLRDLNGSRIMDVGYDIRGSTLYVSHFWNDSAVLKITTHGLFNPRITDDPKSFGIAYEDFRSLINATAPDNGTSVWALEPAPDWLSILESNETSCLLGGYPTDAGSFKATLSVSDSNSSATVNWTITISQLKTVRGYVRDSAGDPLRDQAVMIALKSNDGIRNIEYAATDEQGYYSLVFDQGDWSPGDVIEVSSSFDNMTELNATVADNYPYQSIDLMFPGEKADMRNVYLFIALTCSGAAAIVAFALWSRRRTRPSP